MLVYLTELSNHFSFRLFLLDLLQVLISLLSNEAGAVRDLATTCLANLLNCETVKNKMDCSVQKRSRQRIKDQIEACNGNIYTLVLSFPMYSLSSIFHNVIFNY